MQFNRYKYQQYPLWTLLPLLGKEGKLTEAQAKFLAPYRPYEELYDLQADPHEVENLAESPDHQNVLNDLRVRASTTGLRLMATRAKSPKIRRSSQHKQRICTTNIESAPDSQLSPEEYIKTWEQKLLE